MRAKAKDLATLLRDKESLLKERAEFYSEYAHEFQSGGSARGSLRSVSDFGEVDPPPYDSRDHPSHLASNDFQRLRGHQRAASQPQSQPMQPKFSGVSTSSTTSSRLTQEETPSSAGATAAAPQKSPSSRSLSVLTGSGHKRGPSQSSQSTTSSHSPISPYPPQKQQLVPLDDDFNPRASVKAPLPQAAPNSPNPHALISPKVSGTATRGALQDDAVRFLPHFFVIVREGSLNVVFFR